MSADGVKVPRGLLTRIAPGLIFVVLAVLTTVVWRQEISTQRNLLQRHTDDVTMQGARRLELFVGLRLTAAKLFARRWATHERHDYSRARFEQFGEVFISELPAVRAVQLVPASQEPGWRVARVTLTAPSMRGLK